MNESVTALWRQMYAEPDAEKAALLFAQAIYLSTRGRVRVTVHVGGREITRDPFRFSTDDVIDAHDALKNIDRIPSEWRA